MGEKSTDHTKRFAFSVIVPIYNTEQYLSETIDSVIHQTIGFEEHIQLVLVNDGSKDGSGDICKRYQEQFPKNIVYVEQENGGVSSARNHGLELAEGTLINFLDSDDIWSEDAFSLAKAFFETKEAQQVDVLSFGIQKFERVNENHPLNYKYEKTRVVDLKREYSFIHLMNGNCFIRREAIGALRYQENISYMEDALFINEILLQNCSCGVSAEGRYHLRVRDDRSNLSTVVATEGTVRYLRTPAECFRGLFDLSLKYRGKIERFIQFTIAYEMQWRLSEKLPDSMTEEEIDTYTKLLADTLQSIDDVVILGQRSIDIAQKAYMLKLKYGAGYKPIAEQDALYSNDRTRMLDIAASGTCHIHLMEREGDQVVIKGSTYLYDLGIPFALFVKDSKGNKYAAEFTALEWKDRLSFNGDVLSGGHIFTIRFPLADRNKYSLWVSMGEGREMKTRAFFGVFGKFDHSVENSFWVTGKHIVKFMDGEIRCYKYSARMHLASEYRYRKAIKEKNYIDAREKTALRKKALIKSFLKGRRRICLLHEGQDPVEDGARALFEYICTKRKGDDRIVPYMVLRKESPDYERLRKMGRVLDPGSLKYKTLFLNADYVIAAQAENAVIQPFRGQVHCLAGLLNYKFIPLQEGTRQRSLEQWLIEENARGAGEDFVYRSDDKDCERIYDAMVRSFEER